MFELEATGGNFGGFIKEYVFRTAIQPFQVWDGTDRLIFHFAQSDEAIIMLSLRKQKNSPTRVKRENR